MKLSTLLLTLLFAVSCTSEQQTKNENIQQTNVDHAQQLIDNGYLKYADSSKTMVLKEEILSSFNIYNEDNFRITHIDAEELTEFSFDFFLPGLNRILEKRGVRISAIKLNDKEDTNEAVINSDTVQLYTQKDLDNGTFWDKASRNFFQKVNNILESKGIEDRFYLLYGGNDLHAILLTERQFSIIKDYYGDDSKVIPYKP